MEHRSLILDLGPYPERAASSPSCLDLFLKVFNWPVPFKFPTKILYAFFVSSKRVMYRQSFLVDLISLQYLMKNEVTSFCTASLIFPAVFYSLRLI
jgi:hypothetical protein